MNSKEQSKLEHIIRNFIWQFIHSLFVTALFPFIIRSLMIRKWGMEYLGINGLFSAVLQVLNIAELGMGSAILYSMYKPMAQHDIGKVNALLNLYRRIYKILGVGLLLVGLAVMPFFPYLIQSDCPADVNIYLVFVIYLLDTVIGYITYAYWNVILQADQQTGVNYKICAVCDSMMYLFQIVIICNSHNYYLFIILLPVKTLIVNAVRARYVRGRYPLIRCEGKLEKTFLREFYKRVYAMALSKIRTAIRSSIDSIAISAKLGLVLLAQYQNYYQVMLIPDLIVGVVKGAVLPSFGVNVATESKEANYSIFEVYSFVNNWISTWCTICFLCLVQNFMCLWAGEKNLLSDSVVVLFCVYFYLNCVSQNALMVREVTGTWWIGRSGAVIESIANLIFNFVFVRFWGIQGVLVATVITVLCINLPIEYYSIFKEYFRINALRYFLRQVVYLLQNIIIGTMTYMVCRKLPLGSIKSLILGAGICIILPNLMYILLNFYRREFKEVFHRLVQIKR